MAINGQIFSDVTSTIGTTTDGTTSVNIYSQAAFLADDGGQTVTFDIVGMDFDNDEVASAKILVRLKNVSGTPSIEGTPIHLVPFAAGSSSGLINCSASVTIVGTNIRVNVIGVADRTISWTCNRFPSLSVLDNWTAVSSPADGEILKWSDSTNRWLPGPAPSGSFSAGGDLTGTSSSQQVVDITGTLISNTYTCDLYAVHSGVTNRNFSFKMTPRTANVAPGTLSILGADAWASSTGANRTGGNIVIVAGQGVGGQPDGNIEFSPHSGTIRIYGDATDEGITINAETRVTSNSPMVIDTVGLTLGNTKTFPTATTVGSAGAADALPSNPTGYLRITINGVEKKIPYYDT